MLEPMRPLPAPGEVFAGRYRVERVIGSGGMGVVLEATHLHLEERVAIKMLLPSLSSDAAFVGRFLREGRASVKIRSEHVARVFDVATLDDGTPYMVMEYLAGSDLGHLLEKLGPLSVALTADYVLQACEALAEAHSRDIVHRDIKPSNLFLTKRPDGTECIKVLDFGISKAISTSNSQGLAATTTDTVMGSPLYMAPEQMRAPHDVDARCDIWSLGVILYELVSGMPPFSAPTIPELCAIVLRDAPPPLEGARPDAPAGLARVVQRCLEKEPRDRFADVADFARALAPFGGAGARASSERIMRVLGNTGQAEKGRASLACDRTPRAATQRNPLVSQVGAGLVVLALVAASIALVVRRANRPVRAAAATAGSPNGAAMDSSAPSTGLSGAAASLSPLPELLPLESPAIHSRATLPLATASAATRPHSTLRPPPRSPAAGHPATSTPAGLATSRFE
jgi:serine/threonine-protein kinase